MDLNDDLSWMKLVRRVRFYLPSGEFYDSDFDVTMGMKEIKKIIGLIASIKEPFTLFYDKIEIPDTNEETLNSLFKAKPFEEIITIQIHIIPQNKIIKVQKESCNEQRGKKSSFYKDNNIKPKVEKKENKKNSKEKKSEKEKDSKMLSTFRKYLKKQQKDGKNEIEEKADNLNDNYKLNNMKEIPNNKQNINLNIGMIKNSSDDNNENLYINSRKEQILKSLGHKIKLSGIVKNNTSLSFK